MKICGSSVSLHGAPEIFHGRNLSTAAQPSPQSGTLPSRCPAPVPSGNFEAAEVVDGIHRNIPAPPPFPVRDDFIQDANLAQNTPLSPRVKLGRSLNGPRNRRFSGKTAQAPHAANPLPAWHTACLKTEMDMAGQAARYGRIPGHGGTVLRFSMRGIRELRNFAPPRPFINGAILFFPAGGKNAENPGFPTDRNVMPVKQTPFPPPVSYRLFHSCRVISSVFPSFEFHMN